MSLVTQYQSEISFQEGFFADKRGRSKSVSPCNFPFADTHCHLSMLEGEKGSGQDILYKDTVDALVRAAQVGVRFISCITDPVEDAYDPLAFLSWLDELKGQAIAQEPLAEELDIRVSCGCHPHNAKDFSAENQHHLQTMLAQPITSAIGEIGLDYHYDFSPRDVQKQVFIQQLQLAHELDFPVALHLREASDDAYEILKNYGIPRKGALLHCFNLGKEEFQRFYDLGCSFSIGGPISFNSCEDLREAMYTADISRIMVETDAPFMAPVPLRGLKCEPSFCAFTTQYLCKLFQEHQGIEFEEVGSILYDNARRYYDRVNEYASI